MRQCPNRYTFGTSSWSIRSRESSSSTPSTASSSASSSSRHLLAEVEVDDRTQRPRVCTRSCERFVRFVLFFKESLSLLPSEIVVRKLYCVSCRIYCFETLSSVRRQRDAPENTVELELIVA